MGNGGYSSIIMIILMLVIFYLFLILPENKKKKKLNEMRSSLKVGDDIVTIGGMMGKVVHVTDDSVTFETSEDQVRIQVAKWAISTNARAEAQAAMQALSTRPCTPFGNLLYHGRLTGFCRFSPALTQKRLSWASRIRRMQALPATVPTTAANESSKPISHTA